MSSLKKRSDPDVLFIALTERHPELVRAIAEEVGATPEQMDVIDEECSEHALTPAATFAWNYSKMALGMFLAPIAGVALIIRMICIGISCVATYVKSVPAYAAIRFLPEPIAQRVWWTTRPMHASYYKMITFPVWEEQIMRMLGWKQGARPRTRGVLGWLMAGVAFFVFLPLSLVLSVLEFGGFVIEFASCLLATGLGYAVRGCFPAELGAMTAFFVAPFGLKMDEYRSTKRKRAELIAM